MAEYYQNRDVVVRFDVFKDGDKETPSSASVLVYGPDKEYLTKDAAPVQSNEVRYVLKGNHVEKVGKYTFVFDVKIKQLGGYTHIVMITTKKLPIPNRKKE